MPTGLIFLSLLALAGVVFVIIDIRQHHHAMRQKHP
jgi:hypothetical protein